MAKIPVLEIFGPTIQGEGRVIGRKTMFVRTAGCDYRCSWCDSAFTWDGSAKEDIKLMTAEEIYDALLEIGGHRFNHVTISGGNPALIKGIQELVDLFEDKHIYTALETQGSRFQSWMTQIDDLTISPKPPSHRYPNIPFYLQVGNPYLDDNVDQHTDKLLERYEQLVDRVMQSSDMNHVYVLPQLHTLLWSNKKGV